MKMPSIKFYRFIPAALIFFAATAISTSPLTASEAAPVVVQPLSGKIRVDGVLDEPQWKENPSVIRLTQVEPHQGEPPTEATKVWLAYSEDALYIAVLCEDREPGRIIATEMRRDAILQDNDNLEIILDTHHDHRNAYYFSTNPAAPWSTEG
jgi:hypothetical protein